MKVGAALSRIQPASGGALDCSCRASLVLYSPKGMVSNLTLTFLPDFSANSLAKVPSRSSWAWLPVQVVNRSSVGLAWANAGTAARASRQTASSAAMDFSFMIPPDCVRLNA